MKKIKVGSDFSGVGAFNQALLRLGIDYEELFACDMDKYSRQTFCLNYGTENDVILSKIDMLGKTTISPNDYSFYFPKDVYEREIPKESLDVYMTSPPCQGFSMAGKRDGSILFFNSLEFIQENKPRYFIFENVKGLLSHDKVDKSAEFGRTFQEWINYLGGKSVNGVHTFFPYEDAVPYHIYYQVLNAKHYGIPQNRERIFIIGIRDDVDNDFSFPKPFPLEKRLKDVLESEVDEKYFLSDKMISFFNENIKNNKEKGNGFAFKPKSEEESANSITTKSGSRMDDNFIKVSKEVRTKESKAKRRETGTNDFRGKEIEFREQEVMNTITTSLTNDHFIKFKQTLEINENGTSNALTTVQKDNVVVEYQLTGGKWDKTHEQSGRVYDKNGIAPTIHTMQGGNQEPKVSNMQRIRRLTPFECFRLMDFNENFKWNVSDSQAYKQAGNSICVGVLVEIIKKLKL